MSSTSLKQALRKKIDSPLAKYSTSGQLFCVLCNAQVKNELFWTGHVNGKAHKEKLVALKGQQPQAQQQQTSAFKSPSPASIGQPQSTQSHVFKRPAPPQDGESGSGDSRTPGPPAKKPNLAVVPTGSSNDRVKEQRRQEAEAELRRMVLGGSIVKQNVDEHDDDEEMGSGSNDTQQDKQATAQAGQGQAAPPPLPEGFFDDPKEDAKARGLKFRDPQDAEWDRFMKEIATEDVKSSELVGIDQEASAVDRELDQIEEQMAQWQRVIDLEKRAEEWGKKAKSGQQRPPQTSDSRMEIDDDDDNDHQHLEKQHQGIGNGGSTRNRNSNDEVDDDDDDDEEEYNEELEWRNKKR